MDNEMMELFLKMMFSAEESKTTGEGTPEMDKLANLLTAEGIPFKRFKKFLGHQICYYGPNGRQEPADNNGSRGYVGAGVGAVCSVIFSSGSYGHEEGLLEISGLLTAEEYEREHDTVLGYLDAENVFARIKKHYLENK